MVHILLFLSSCFLLSPKHPCHNITGRNTFYTISQPLPNDININEQILNIVFAIADAMSTSEPPECVELIQHYICLLSAPPCDPKSQLPELLCPKNCQAYNKLKEAGTCDRTIQSAHNFAVGTKNSVLFASLELYEALDCYNASTYYFFEDEMYAEKDMCTNIISEESQGN